MIAVLLGTLLMLFVKDDYSKHSHEKNAILAYNRLQSLKDSTKIVIIGGSNGGFGINSRMIKDSFKIPVINTCTQAGLGIRLEFEIYKDLLSEGDIVLFIPEYGSDKSFLYGEATVFRILNAHLPFCYNKLTATQWLNLYKYLGVYFTDFLSHIGTKKATGPYSENSLNEFGDIECEREHKSNIKNVEISEKLDESLISYYKYVHDFAHNKHLRLVFLPPSLMASSYKKNYQQIESFAEQLKQSGIPWQSSPINYVFPDTLFYDTPYHLIQPGANIRTEQMIKDIQRILQMR